MSQQVIGNFSNPYFQCEILKGSEKFPGFLPPISGNARMARDHNKFISKKKADYLRRYDRSILDVIDTLKEYEKRFNTFSSAIKDLFTDYDKEHVLPTTCALSLWNSASTDLDNLGALGLDNDVTYSKDVENAVIAHYTRYLPKSPENVPLSLVRGKMIGYPFMVGGMNRALNDVFLAVSAALVIGTQKTDKKTSLENLYTFLRQFHGEPFAMEGSRQQHTSKEMAMVLKEGVFSSINFNPRYRIINMDPKISVMDIRQEIKMMLEAIKNSPFHTQNREAIEKRIRDAEKKNWKIVSVDHSKFDFRHGGKRGMQQIQIHAKILKSDHYLNSASLSFKTRFLTFGHKQVWEYPGDALLKSGMGNTTIIGCTGNLSGFLAAMSYATGDSPTTVLNNQGRTWDALMWGDDCVAMFEDHELWDKVVKGFEHFKLKVEPEPTIKFLGSNYSKGEFKGTMDTGYSIGRAFQQQFFPERPKIYPFNKIGYIARLDLMGPRGHEFHKRMLPNFATLELGEPFTFADRHAHLETLIPEMQKLGDKIQMIDDVLQIFTHGLPDIADTSADVPPIYLKLLGMEISADLTNPEKFLRDEVQRDQAVAKTISSSMMQKVGKLVNGDRSVYSSLVSEMSAAFKLNHPTGSVIY